MVEFGLANLDTPAWGNSYCASLIMNNPGLQENSETGDLKDTFQIDNVYCTPVQVLSNSLKKDKF